MVDSPGSVSGANVVVGSVVTCDVVGVVDNTVVGTVVTCDVAGAVVVSAVSVTAICWNRVQLSYR